MVNSVSVHGYFLPLLKASLDSPRMVSLDSHVIGIRDRRTSYHHRFLPTRVLSKPSFQIPTTILSFKISPSFLFSRQNTKRLNDCWNIVVVESNKSKLQLLKQGPYVNWTIDSLLMSEQDLTTETNSIVGTPLRSTHGRRVQRFCFWFEIFWLITILEINPD